MTGTERTVRRPSVRRARVVATRSPASTTLNAGPALRLVLVLAALSWIWCAPAQAQGGNEAAEVSEITAPFLRRMVRRQLAASSRS